MTAASPVATRALSPRQATTRRRLVDAALGLVGERPFDAVTMRDVAAAAGVSVATAYTYFGSKEHLLAEVYADWVGALGEQLRARPPQGATALARVRSVVRRALDGVEAAPQLARAFTRAVASSDPSVALVRPTLHGALRDWLDVALGDREVPDREAVVRTLELTMFAGMLSYTHGHLGLAELRTALDDATRLLLDR